MDEISPQEFKEKINSDEKPLLLDVREPFEQYQSNIEYENSQLIPVDQLPGRLNEIKAEKNEEIICICRSGGRSAEARDFLNEEGFENVKSLQGGINRWAKEIDNSLPIY